MVGLDEIPLSQFVPRCHFAVVLDTYLAGEARELTVKQQLEHQRVEWVSLCKMRKHEHGMLGWLPSDLLYWIFLKKSDSLAEWMKSIGHELAHTIEGPETFHPFELKLPDGCSTYATLEKLCEQFATRWLELPSVQASKWEVLSELAMNGKIRLAIPPLTT